MKKLYKFYKTDLTSTYGKTVWKIGEWHHEEDAKLCSSGFHASKTALQALGYVKGEIIAEVHVKGKSDISDDKECWTDMKITKAYHWTKKDSVELAVFAAELVLTIYETKYPGDDRPRKAIECAKEYLKTGVRPAADAAAADAAAAAADAAYAYAAYAYAAACRAIRGSKLSKVVKDVTPVLNKWFMKKIKTLEIYDQK